MTPIEWSRIAHFTRSEFVCHCGCGEESMSYAFIVKLDALRSRLNVPLTVLSGFRCPEHNNIVSSTGLHGPHTMGLAADIQASGRAAWLLLAAAMHMEFAGIGVRQKGEKGARYIHLDSVRSDLRPSVWSY